MKEKKDLKMVRKEVDGMFDKLVMQAGQDVVAVYPPIRETPKDEKRAREKD